MSTPNEVFDTLYALLRTHSTSHGTSFTASTSGSKRRATLFYSKNAVYLTYYNREGDFAVNVIWTKGVHFAGFCVTSDGIFPIISNTTENGTVIGDFDATSDYKSLILNIEENLGMLVQQQVPQAVVVNNKNVTKKIKKNAMSWWRLFLALTMLVAFLWLIAVFKNLNTVW